MRTWHIPPIHLVKLEGGTLEVLDGQQRLRSIYSFANDEYPFDGNLDPYNRSFEEIDGLYYSQFSSRWKSIFNEFSIRQFVLVEYEPTEPYELFYRLNQSVQLSPPEQRNAFYGRTRDQIHNLTDFAISAGWSKNTIGFDNKRMAYQDILARCAFALELGNISSKISASHLAEWYRESQGISRKIQKQIKFCITCLSEASYVEPGLKLNKASAFSWLIAFARLTQYSEPSKAIHSLQETLHYLSSRTPYLFNDSIIPLPFDTSVNAAAIFKDRSSSRVADTNSVILRDAAIWGLAGSLYLPHKLRKRSEYIIEILNHNYIPKIEHELVSCYLEYGWDELPDRKSVVKFAFSTPY